MKKRDRRRRQPPTRRWATTSAAPATMPAAARRSWERIGWIVAGVAVPALIVSLVYRNWPASSAERLAEIKPLKQEPPPAAPKQAEPDSFLDEFNAKESAPVKEGDKPALTDAELEQHFAALAAVNEQVEALKAQKRDFAAAMQLQTHFDRAAVTLEKVLAAAKLARPDAAVPRWLTGELLLLVGGEPEEILPHLEYALKQGLRRPRLLASLAREQLQANRFADAYRSAETALDHAGQDRYVWKVYERIAFSSNRFDEVRDKLGRAFPDDPPEWVRTIRNQARDLQEAWAAELKTRAAEAKADDLPRVRLVIEHRRFGKDAEGKPLTTVDSTGRETVVVELFENEAPVTVANFIDLVTRGVYDGTRFHLAVPAVLVTGGDPLTRSDSTDDDGTGGPGYVIPDEFRRPGARKHFRGSLSMVNTGPHTAGSQFFCCLSPAPEADGRHTVFGRIIAGQEAVDRITRGRTTKKLEVPGRLIPGDLLVRAEVVRKRAHEYPAVKE